MSKERVTPFAGEDKELIAQHKARYLFASKYAHGRHILDIACGYGYGTEILLRGKPSRIIGIDLSSEAIEFANQRYATTNVIFLQGNAEQMPTLDVIDLVISFETIEHLSHPDRFLKKVTGILPAGGMLIISTPIRTTGTIETKPANPFHVREWNEEEFLSFLSLYFGKYEVYYQFLIKKKSYPGSRTVAKIASKIIAPDNYQSFMEFSVTAKAPMLPVGSVIKGYIIVVCIK